jgi:hypothetical protein
LAVDPVAAEEFVDLFGPDVGLGGLGEPVEIEWRPDRVEHLVPVLFIGLAPAGLLGQVRRLLGRPGRHCWPCAGDGGGVLGRFDCLRGVVVVGGGCDVACCETSPVEFGGVDVGVAELASPVDGGVECGAGVVADLDEGPTPGPRLGGLAEGAVVLVGCNR